MSDISTNLVKTVASVIIAVATSVSTWMIIKVYQQQQEFFTSQAVIDQRLKEVEKDLQNHDNMLVLNTSRITVLETKYSIK